MNKKSDVPRPLERTEYEIVFISSEAQKGWIDCLAVARNATVDAWEQFTANPQEAGFARALYDRAPQGDR
ncbi:hypothetical protein [Nocardia sp. NPDC058705]|uniref:hypothetical protein n=1 Tax=Nocardia sp. NPDC058705 TaxID=3346609 RepID=UPI00369BDB7B